jgi:hypothetical protein
MLLASGRCALFALVLSMPRNTGRPSLPLDEPRLDGRVCAEIGARLAHARSERKLTIAMVADSLLLSTRQVRALEQAESGAFYNSAFFLAALRKYARLAGVEADLLGRALVLEARPSGTAESSPAVARPAPSVGFMAAPEPSGTRRARGLALSAIVCALVGIGGAAVWSLTHFTSDANGSTPQPHWPPGITLPAPFSIEGSRVPAPAASTDDPRPTASLRRDPAGPYGGVRVARSTWVFLRYANGDMVEHTLEDGEEEVIESQPVYLAVGIPDVELTVGDRHVDVSRFVVNGQVRIRSADLGALTAGGADDTIAR